MPNNRSRSRHKKTAPVMVPLHIKLTEEMHALLADVAKAHGFPRIQGLIRLYIRQGLDAENVGYSLAQDRRFLEKLKRQGVSETIINEALKLDATTEAATPATTNTNPPLPLSADMSDLITTDLADLISPNKL
ncbi:CopG family transcriptional regulator [Moraxella atlantae]|uniref:CopG family transcriptional regulator n=1 Tax=Faucicola atlantae TaxID=34059 RepID=UPI0037526417